LAFTGDLEFHAHHQLSRCISVFQNTPGFFYKITKKANQDLPAINEGSVIA
jgi:hypothetical protein